MPATETGTSSAAHHLTAPRLHAQLLSGNAANSAVDVVERLLAVQGQDPRGARLAVRARSDGLTAADVDQALTVDRTLLITWLNRSTLHLVRTEDYWWLHQLTAPTQLTGTYRRLAQEGVTPDDAERAVGVIEAALVADGPLSRAQLGERIAVTGVRTGGQALVHLLFLASNRGICVRGPVSRGQQLFVLVRDWLGQKEKLANRDRALAELARRYLAGHGPADDRDLAKWAGLPLRDARRGLGAISAELRDRPDGLAELASSDVADSGLPAPRLLGAFDPVLLGWVSRAPIVGEHHQIITTNGLFRPFALVGGKAVALWRLADSRVELIPLSPISAADEDVLRADADEVRRFLGPSTYSAR